MNSDEFCQQFFNFYGNFQFYGISEILTSFAQESQKMYLECRVASNPSVLVFGRLNQAPDQATTCSPCEKFAF